MNILKRIAKGALFGLGGIVALYLLLVIFAVVHSKPIKQLPWYQTSLADHHPIILAHQGGEGEYPSNSKLAFSKAAEVAVEALDTDVFMTSDKHFVLFHDETLEHRTNGTGAISTKTLAELQQVDFAYNWSQDGGKTFPYRGQGITVYTLDDLLTDFPNQRYGIEIKQITSEATTAFCDLIKERHVEDKVLVSSVKQPNMDTFRKACPTVATSATDPEAKKFFILSKLYLSGLFKPAFSSLQVPEKSGGFTVASKSFNNAAHAWGLKVYNWTIDTAEQDQHFTDQGADGINTSFPKRITMSRAIKVSQDSN